ncbi:MAG: phosphocholine cytidylyltransferase family protein [Polyangiaceae bacterium]|nr:phosphocholine cytidylyltransferase family protein [Polyangiaceae bacterium]
MRAVIIGAGRGSRLGPHTESIPKTLVEVMGRPMLDWILDALSAAGFARSDIVFISGFAEEHLRARYPDLTYVRNRDWPNNNILLSLLCARDYLGDGFVSTYSDIVYEPELVARLVRRSEDIVLGSDTAWRRRYADRSQHPDTDAEKLRARGQQVIEISRRITPEHADGEFVGVMKLSRAGAAEFVAAFDRARVHCADGVFHEGRTLQRAYLIDLLQYMLELGSVMHREDTDGGYMEIDTVEDLAHAAQWWASRPHGNRTSCVRH